MWHFSPNKTEYSIEKKKIEKKVDLDDLDLYSVFQYEFAGRSSSPLETTQRIPGGKVFL